MLHFGTAIVNTLYLNKCAVKSDPAGHVLGCVHVGSSP